MLTQGNHFQLALNKPQNNGVAEAGLWWGYEPSRKRRGLMSCYMFECCELSAAELLASFQRRLPGFSPLSNSPRSHTSQPLHLPISCFLSIMLCLLPLITVSFCPFSTMYSALHSSAQCTTCLTRSPCYSLLFLIYEVWSILSKSLQAEIIQEWDRLTDWALAFQVFIDTWTKALCIMSRGAWMYSGHWDLAKV